jgi:hypothetical protein
VLLRVRYRVIGSWQSADLTYQAQMREEDRGKVDIS